MTFHRIDLPWSTPPLSLNDRGHWAPRARAIKDVRETGRLLAKAAQLEPCERIRVELHYQPRVRRGRDNENLVATAKPLIDGLTDAGVIPDDTDEYVERTMPTIHPTSDTGRMWLVVTVLVQAGA